MRQSKKQYPRTEDTADGLILLYAHLLVTLLADELRTAADVILPWPHHANRACSIWRITDYAFAIIKSTILSFTSIAATFAFSPKHSRLLHELSRKRKLQASS
jgi:hypothetical protein